MKPEQLPKPIKPTGTFSELTDKQREQLAGWLNSSQTYRETIQRVETEFGIPGVSIGVLKNFRRKYNAAFIKERPVCPPSVPREIWEASLEKMKNVLQDEGTKIETRVRVSAFLLQLFRVTLDYDRASAKTRRPKPTKATGTADNEEEPNPLDDQEKLDEIRRQVFGSAPNTKNSGSTP